MCIVGIHLLYKKNNNPVNICKYNRCDICICVFTEVKKYIVALYYDTALVGDSQCFRGRNGFHHLCRRVLQKIGQHLSYNSVITQ